jgi:V/A-type H+-transporting ATPase subunit E
MSGADKICEKIIRDAEEKAAEHIRKAEEKAAEIIREMERKAAENREKRLQKALVEARNLEERIVAAEEMEFKNNKLKLKQDIISKAFEIALKRLAELPDDEYRQLIINMVMPLIREGNEKIVISARDRERLKGIDDDINGLLKEKGINGKVVISGNDGGFLGGFILGRGRMEINCTLETLVGTRRPELETEVANILFG